MTMIIMIKRHSHQEVTDDSDAEEQRVVPIPNP